MLQLITVLWIAAKMSLGFQNATVVLCATFLCMVMMFETQLKNQIDEPWVEIAGQGLVVAMAVLSRLGSLANIICVEKDWLIVLAHGSREKLAGQYIKNYHIFFFFV